MKNPKNPSFTNQLNFYRLNKSTNLGPIYGIVSSWYNAKYDTFSVERMIFIPAEQLGTWHCIQTFTVDESRVELRSRLRTNDPQIIVNKNFEAKGRSALVKDTKDILAKNFNCNLDSNANYYFEILDRDLFKVFGIQELEILNFAERNTEFPGLQSYASHNRNIIAFSGRNGGGGFSLTNR